VSDPPPHWRRIPDLMAADLHALLRAAGIPPPYVLVGHSIGGIITRRFYAQRPGLVAGMLLVDSSHEQQAQRFAALDRRRGAATYRRVAMRRQARILGAPRLAVRLGIMQAFEAEIARSCCHRAAGGWRYGKCSWRRIREARRQGSVPSP
jgi:pimeloyl-ACP methyl ester carboxylesterase